MVNKNELRGYQDMSVERWASRNFALCLIIAGALLVMAVAGFTIAQPHANPTDHSGIFEFSASQKRSNTAFDLMSTASDKLPIESWGEQAF